MYFDSNSIIYDCLRILSKEYESYSNDDKFENDLIELVCKEIEKYIYEIAPNKRVMIAFDGVAPVAKLEQQRTRRHKSMLEKKIHESIFGKKKEWNKTAITPGTNFMTKLNTNIDSYFKGQEKKYGVEQIIFSGSDQPGEGEHKLFHYIREHSTSHKTEVSVVYGLDADPIMLCLNHLRISKQIYYNVQCYAFFLFQSKSSTPRNKQKS